MWVLMIILFALAVGGLVLMARRAREGFEKVFFWMIVVVVAGFMASGLVFLVRRVVVGSFISG